MILLGISTQTFRARSSSTRSREVPSRRDRVRISRVATVVTSSVHYLRRTGDHDCFLHCSVFEKQPSPLKIFPTSVRSIFHRSIFDSTIRLPVFDRAVFASSSPYANTFTNLIVVCSTTKFQRSELVVYCAHRFLRTFDPTKHVSRFPRIIGQGWHVKVRRT